MRMGLSYVPFFADYYEISDAVLEGRGVLVPLQSVNIVCMKA